MPNFSEIFYAVVAYLIKQYDLVYVLVFLDSMWKEWGVMDMRR